MGPDSETRRLQLLRAAAADAGGTAHRIRVVLIGLIFLRLILVVGDEMLAGVMKHWLTTAFLVAGLLLSALIDWKDHGEGSRTPWMVASTVLDACLATAVILPSVIWPRETFLGVLRAPDILIFPIIAAAGGLRMTRQTAAVGGVAAGLGLAVLVAVDQTLNAGIVRYGVAEVLLAAALLAGATLLALGTVAFVEKLLLSTMAEAAEARRVRDQFGAYVAEEFAELVLAPGQLKPRRVDAAVLFSDLRGFTRYSEHTPPDALVDELNAYFEAVVAAVEAHGGIVDKYIGDAVMAVFGLPGSSGDEACRAIRAAEAMKTALDRHNVSRAVRGLPALRQGIGVHYGEVVAGPVGTAARRQFTVLGDTVNVAARLEAATKELDTGVLVSGAAVSRAEEEGQEIPALVESGPLELRGRTEPVPTFRLRDALSR